MTKYIGRLVTLGVAKEASRGVGVAPTYIMPQTSLSFDDKVQRVNSEVGLGSIMDSDEGYVTTLYGQGDLEGNLRDKSIGLILYSLMGAVSTAGPTDSLYTHTFTISESNTHQSLCFTVNDPNTKEQYTLVMVDSFEMTAELDEPVKFSASFMSKKGNSSTASMPALVSENVFTKKHLTVKFAADTGSLAAASSVSIKSITLTVSNNTELDDVLGTAEPEDIVNKQMVVEGRLNLTTLMRRLRII
jgi:hypothetical protein